jgi:hypothetical protein
MNLGVLHAVGNQIIPNSVSVSDSAHRFRLLLVSGIHPNTCIIQRPSALVSTPIRHGVQEVASSNLAAPIE